MCGGEKGEGRMVDVDPGIISCRYRARLGCASGDGFEAVKDVMRRRRKRVGDEWSVWRNSLAGNEVCGRI